MKLKILVFCFCLFVNSAIFAAENDKRAVGVTWLKANPENAEMLYQYLSLNWLVMDQKAVEQGVFVAYQLLENSGDEDDWDFLMIVTYKDDKGYNGVKAEFDAIRAAHKEVLVDGKSLRQLGKIVRSTYYYETVTP